MDGWSQASETDRVVFSVLSNSDRLDLSSLPTTTPHIEEVLPTIAEGREQPSHEHSAHDDGAGVHPKSGMYEERPPVRDEERPPVRDEERPIPPVDPFPVHREEPPAPPVDPFPVRSEHAPRDEATTTYRSRSVDPQDREEDPRPQLSVDEQNQRDEEKRTVLLDLQRLESHSGIRLTKQWDMNDSLEDMTLELRRHVLTMDEKSNVSMMRDGLRMLVTGMEMVSNRWGVLDLEGWSSDVCRDLSRHDTNLARCYRKYWRRSTSNSPETDILFGILGSAGLHHMKRTMSKQMLRRNTRGASSSYSSRRQPINADSSDEEEAPHR